MAGFIADLEKPRRLAAVGLAVGLAHLLVLALLDTPTIANDAQAYHEIGLSLSRGEPWLRDGVAQTEAMPGYPTVVGLIYLIFGPHPAVVRGLQALLVGLDAVLMYRVAGRVSPRFAPLGLLFFALAPVFAVYPATLLSENLTITLVLLYLEMLTAELPAAGRGQVLWAVRFGLVGGALCFTRAEFNLWMVAVPALLLGRVSLRRLVGLTAIAALVVALCLAPWVIRNAVLHHQFIPFTTLSGRTLWMSAQQPEQTEVGSPGYQAAMARCATRGTPREIDACMGQDARRAIAEHRGYFVRSSLGRAVRTMVGSHTDALAGGTQYSFGQAIAGGRWGLLAFKGLNLLFHGVLVVLAIAGLVRQRAARLWQVIAWALFSKILIHALIFGTSRYGVPLQSMFLVAALGLMLPPPGRKAAGPA